MSSSFEEQYFDVLHAIESAIVRIYTAHPEMKDRHATSALKGLMRTYKAALAQHPAPRIKLNALEQMLYSEIEAAMKIFMSGFTPAESSSEVKTYTIDEIIACLKRIQSSITTWTKTQGYGANINGYLEFVKDYVR